MRPALFFKLSKFVLLLLCFAIAYNSFAQQVYFSPKGGCQEAICREIDSAKSNVMVQAYTFSNGTITRALTDASRRGVQVSVILDKSQAKGKEWAQQKLTLFKITTLVDFNHAIAHNKIIIIDNKTVITGSYNFTYAAETTNAENIVILTNQAVVSQFSSNWTFHAQHSQPFKPTTPPSELMRRH